MIFNISTLPKRQGWRFIPVIAMASLMTGCVHHNVLPKTLMEAESSLPETMIIPLTSPATHQLDCISEKAKKIPQPLKVVVGHIRNRLNGQGELPLPNDFRDFVKASLARFTSGIAVFNTEEVTGHTPSESQLNTASPEINNQIPVALRIKPKIVVAGALTYGEKVKVTEYEGDLFGLSSGAVSEVVLLTGYLELIKADTRQSIATPRHLSASIFNLRKGGSLFVLSGNDFVRGRVQVEVGHPVTYGLQLLFDSMIAGLFSELISQNYGINMESCLKNDLNLDFDITGGESEKSTLIITLKRPPKDKSTLCIKIDSIRGVDYGSHAKVITKVYRGGTYLALKRINRIPTSVFYSEFPLCLKAYRFEKEHSISVQVLNRGGAEIGSTYARGSTIN